MKRALILGLTVASLAFASAAAEPTTSALPDAGEIIRRFIEQAAHSRTNQSAGAVVFFRTNVTEEFNSRGRLTEREELLLRVTDRNGEKSTELVKLNGREPTDQERERELKRFERRHESSTKREHPDRSRQLPAYFTQEILSRYVFTVTGRETIRGRTCLRLSFKPGAGERKSTKLFERVLDQLGGTLWLHEADHELVKADIQLRKKVSLWGGFLGALEQLRLQIERTREASGQWRDRSVEARFVGRAVTKHIDVRTLDLSSAPQPIETTTVVTAD